MGRNPEDGLHGGLRGLWSGLSGGVVRHQTLLLKLLGLVELVRLPLLVLSRLSLCGQHLQGLHLQGDWLHLQMPLHRLEHPGLVRLRGILQGSRSGRRGGWRRGGGLSLGGRVRWGGRHLIHVRLVACRACGGRRHVG